MSEAEEEDAIGGTCECKILVGSEGKRHKSGNRSSVPGDDNPSLPPYLPPLSDDIALLILARLPSSKYCDLRFMNWRYCDLISKGELSKIRKEIGLKEPKVFLLSDEARCWCYEPYTRSCRGLPVCPYDETIVYDSMNLFCVGTQLLVFGKYNGSCIDIWRYELESEQWFKGPMMFTKRYFFAFADCGSVACVAGGDHYARGDALNSAEKYNPENKSWEPLPNMNMRRSYCSGFYMDSKFYVIGGFGGDLLTCGECYDFERNVWELIPNMLEGMSHFQSPDLMTVVNNELYYLELSSRHLKVYLKNNNTWKKVGRMPARIEHLGGDRVTLKPLGNELLLIGRTKSNPSTPETVLCFCTPSPKLDDVEWHVLDFHRPGRNHYIRDCSVMMI